MMKVYKREARSDWESSHLPWCSQTPRLPPPHIAPRGAKKEEAFGGVILKSERPSGALFTNSGPPFFTVESKIEVLSPLGTSFH